MIQHRDGMEHDGFTRGAHSLSSAAISKLNSHTELCTAICYLEIASWRKITYRFAFNWCQKKMKVVGYLNWSFRGRLDDWMVSCTLCSINQKQTIRSNPFQFVDSPFNDIQVNTVRANHVVPVLCSTLFFHTSQKVCPVSPFTLTLNFSSSGSSLHCVTQQRSGQQRAAACDAIARRAWRDDFIMGDLLMTLQYMWKRRKQRVRK